MLLIKLNLTDFIIIPNWNTYVSKQGILVFKVLLSTWALALPSIKLNIVN